MTNDRQKLIEIIQKLADILERDIDKAGVQSNPVSIEVKINHVNHNGSDTDLIMRAIAHQIARRAR